MRKEMREVRGEKVDKESKEKFVAYYKYGRDESAT